MKKTILTIALVTLCFSLIVISEESNAADVNDPRGAMKPWDKGAWETGKYRPGRVSC